MTTLRKLRITLKFIGLVGFLGLSNASVAQSYPNKLIKLIVPYGATGGGPDFVARTLSDKIHAISGQTVLIENKLGAAATLGTSAAARAPADGYSILVGDTGPLSVAPSLRKELTYDPERDFAPISNGVRAPLFLVVSGQLDVKNIKELIAHLKAKPNLPYGTPGVGSVHHLAMEKLLSMADVKMTHVPYTSVSHSIPAVVSGDLTVLVTAYPSVRAFIASGRLKALAVGNAERVPFAPDVPTLAESGFPGYDFGIDVGFLVPKGTPADVVAKLNTMFHLALKAPEIAVKLTNAGLLPTPSTPDEYSLRIKKDRAAFKAIIDASGIHGN